MLPMTLDGQSPECVMGVIFGRATRLKQHAAELVAGLGVPFSWQLEVAVMLSQIGCIVLSAENNEKLYYGKPLTPVETESTQCVPKIALQLLESIPRLELVCAILDAQEYSFDGSGSPPGAPRGESIPLARGFSSWLATTISWRRPGLLPGWPSAPCRAARAVTIRNCSAPWVA